MTSLDEKIKNYKRDALILFLEGEYYRTITLANWEKAYLKELEDKKAREEAECRNELNQTK